MQVTLGVEPELGVPALLQRRDLDAYVAVLNL